MSGCLCWGGGENVREYTADDGRRQRRGRAVPYIEVRKNGKLVTRREVGADRAEKGCRVRLGSAGEVRVKLGESTVLGEYEVRVLEDTGAEAGSSEVHTIDPCVGGVASGSDVTAPPAEAARPRPARRVGREDLDAAAGAAGPDRDVQAPDIEGYRITGELGKGGMGTVWRAVQLSTKRRVALKFLGTGGIVSERAHKRFEREVQLAARLVHPNLARVYDSGLHRGGYYYAMELIEGQPLDKYVDGHTLGLRDIIELIRIVCLPVEHAHQQGVIHRDLKPSNVLVSEDGQPHVVDFGLARSLQEDDKDLSISIEGEVAGTPAYMAPEQAAGRKEDIGAWTDVYALGVMLYRLLTGRTPHDMTGSKLDILKRLAEEEVDRPRKITKDIDRELEALLLKALSLDPRTRYTTAGELAADLENYLAGRPLTARPPTVVYVARKWLSRHRAGLSAAAGLLVVAGAVLVPLLNRGTKPQVDKPTFWPPGGAIDLAIPVKVTCAMPDALVYYTTDGGEPTESSQRYTGPVTVLPGTVLKARAFREGSAPSLVAEAQYSRVALAEVLRAQKAAELAWQSVRGLDRGQGFGGILDAIDRIRPQGKQFYEKSMYAEAKQAFDSTVERCGALATREQQRQAARQAGIAAGAAAAGAEGAGTQAKAKPFWDKAVALSTQAASAFAEGRFPEARDLWHQGAQEFVRASATVAGAATVTAARAAFGAAMQQHDRAVLEKWGGAAWAKVAEALAQAEQAGSDFAKAAVAYQQAKDLLPEAAAQAKQAMSDQRRVVLAAKSRCDAAAAKARDAQAATYAQAAWESARQAAAQAEAAYKDERYPVASQEWDAAAKQYAEAEKQAASAQFERHLAGARALLALGRCGDALQRLRPALAMRPRDEAALAVMQEIRKKLQPTVYGRWPFDAGEAARRRDETAASLGVQKDLAVPLGGGVTLKLTLIPAGKFIMGSPLTEDGRQTDEGPRREVAIRTPFYLSVTEITQAQWEAAMGKGPWEGKAYAKAAGDHAANYISWDDAMAFCAKVSQVVDMPVRLPTEAQWEYASRAGMAAPFCYGADPTCARLGDCAWWAANAEQAGRRHPQPAGVKAPNAWGLYDMHGNVAEWCRDWYDADYYAQRVAEDPTGPLSGSLRVLRGGSWRSAGACTRHAKRDKGARDARSGEGGFRVAAWLPLTLDLAGSGAIFTQWPFDGAEARRRQEETAKDLAAMKDLVLSLGGGISMKLTLVPAGRFVMGSPKTEAGREDDEGPQHEVTIAPGGRGFYLGVTEVTQAQWEAVMGPGPWKGKSYGQAGADLAANYVSHADATAFCAKLAARVKMDIRLPTEAEWEYACRAGTSTAYCFGDDPDSRLIGTCAWYDRNAKDAGRNHAQKVAQKKPNAWGLYDMHGNVWEWCADWYGPNPYSAGPVRDPSGPATGSWRVARGGSWYSRASDCRSANRAKISPSLHYGDDGFRVAADLKGPGP